MKTPDLAVLSLAEDQLLAWRARMQGYLAPEAAGDFAILQALLETYLWLRQALSAARVSVARLKRYLFGSQSEKTRDILTQTPDPHQIQGNDPEPRSTGDPRPKRKNKGPKLKGHGRMGEAAYPAAQRIPVHHPTFVRGCPCPDEDCRGKLYLLKKPRVALRIFGQPALMAKIWQQDRWRCHFCEKVFDAELPVEAQVPKYDVTAVAMIAILHFGNGFAFFRLEQHQASLQMPLPASNQSELLSKALRKLKPILKEFIRQAAQYEILHNDDTGMKILELMVKIRQVHAQRLSAPAKNKKERTGIHTTAIVAISLTLGHRIALYFTGSKHAGENLATVLEHRGPQLDPPIHESDGLDHNRPGAIRVISGKCLTHGRRQFVDVITSFPDQCRRVVETLGEVYRIDAVAKQKKLSPADRLLLHQEKSGPVMDTLRRWLTDQFLEASVEPNSGLGKAIKYMLKRWTQLTLFLRQVGAPLDNNICERSLKKAIRLRKNSLFYKTQKGADVGDLFTSIIETCALNGVNTFHYLTNLLRNAHRLEASPESWMPWNYQARLDPEVAGDGRGLNPPKLITDDTGPPSPQHFLRERPAGVAGGVNAPQGSEDGG